MYTPSPPLHSPSRTPPLSPIPSLTHLLYRALFILAPRAFGYNITRGGLAAYLAISLLLTIVASYFLMQLVVLHIKLVYRGQSTYDFIVEQRRKSNGGR
eukprot:m.169808 g.169808  ORF g.169808 m.169808 type:complete len:99 (+) comp14509_c0_seq5:1003-1299(+)